MNFHKYMTTPPAIVDKFPILELNSSRAENRIGSKVKINTMAAVALTTDFTRTSTAMEMTLHDKCVLVCHDDNFNHLRHHSAEKCCEIFFLNQINLYINASSAIATRKGSINRIHVHKWLFISPPINRDQFSIIKVPYLARESEVWVVVC